MEVTKIACFIESEEGMEPIGYYDTEVEAVGFLYKAMQDRLTWMAGEDNLDDAHIVFSAQLRAHETEECGFCIKGVCKIGEKPMLFMDDLHWAPTDDPVYRLTGWGLYTKGEA